MMAQENRDSTEVKRVLVVGDLPRKIPVPEVYDTVKFGLQNENRLISSGEIAETVLQDLMQVAGNPTDQEFFEEFTFRLGAKLGIKNYRTQDKNLKQAIAIVEKHFNLDLDKLLIKDFILKTVSEYYGVSPDDLKGLRRYETFTWPRHICFWLIKKLTDESLVTIGYFMGRRHHATILHGVKNVENQIDIYTERENQIKELLSIIENIRA